MISWVLLIGDTKCYMYSSPTVFLDNFNMAEALKFDEEQRRCLLEIAKTLVFVDGNETVEKYRCISCHKVAITHHRTNCKHIFCSNCITKLFYKSCPSCNVKITEVTNDAQVEKGLMELNVECPYKMYGCEKIVPLHKFQEHDRSCPLSTKKLLPKLYVEPRQHEKLNELQDDIRQIKMTIKEIRKDIKKEDFQKETVKSLAIINEKIEIMNQEISLLKTMHHDYDKQFRQFQIELESRKEYERKTTEKIDANQKMVSDFIARIGTSNKLPSENKLSDDERDLQLQGNTRMNPDEFVGEGIVFSWKMDGFPKRWQDMNKTWRQRNLYKHFRDSQFGFEFSASVIFSTSDILIGLSKFGVESMFSHARKFTLVDQSGRADKTSASFIDIPLFSRNSDMLKRTYFRNNILAPTSLFEKHFDAFIKDNSMLVEICIIPLAIMYKSVASRKGILLWRIDNYSKKKQEEIEGIRKHLTSDSFYTASQGYRIQVYLYLNGFDRARGKSISIYVEFISGEFDSTLPIPCYAMAKFFLRDQSDSSRKQHVCQEIMFKHVENGSWHGRTDFVKQSQAEATRYLKEDALLFKFMVEIIKL